MKYSREASCLACGPVAGLVEHDPKWGQDQGEQEEGCEPENLHDLALDKSDNAINRISKVQRAPAVNLLPYFRWAGRLVYFADSAIPLIALNSRAPRLHPIGHSQRGVRA